MNKAEIIAAVAQSTGQTQKVVGEIIKSLTETIKDTASQGEPVRLSGLLNMSVTHRPSRIVNVPSTGKKQESPAKSKSLRQRTSSRLSRLWNFLPRRMVQHERRNKSPAH